MKKLLLATAAAVPLLTGSLASAADLGVRAAAAPAPVVPVYTWTGLYVGAGWGYGMYNLDTQASTVPPLFSASQTLGGRGWLGTVTAGGDYQLNNWLVIGAFGDYDWANIKQNGQNPILGRSRKTRLGNWCPRRIRGDAGVYDLLQRRLHPGPFQRICRHHPVAHLQRLVHRLRR